MQGHGEDDHIIRLEWARRAAEVLGPRCESLEFKTYKDVGHTVSDLQVDTVMLTPTIGNIEFIMTTSSTFGVLLYQLRTVHAVQMAMRDREYGERLEIIKRKESLTTL